MGNRPRNEGEFIAAMSFAIAMALSGCNRERAEDQPTPAVPDAAPASPATTPAAPSTVPADVAAAAGTDAQFARMDADGSGGVSAAASSIMTAPRKAPAASPAGCG